ncbi:hypothetical protein BD414DRAFT_421903 [Trametes punicea]|nr:hypothetical protein BD414DRAFT_421903 [Trametes punicea]
MTRLPPRTILALMQTCRTLYSASDGPGLLLRDGVSLCSDTQVVSFSHFMLADPPVRLHHLRSLTISRGDFSREAVVALSDLLTHPSLRIESLVLHDSEVVLSSGDWVEDWRCASYVDTPLLRALAGVTTLKHLTLDELHERAYHLLDTLSSSLTSATLVLDSPRLPWSALGDADLSNPLVRLAHSADTLEVLEGSGFDMHPDIVLYDVVYPRMRRLRASHASRGLPGTVAYAHAFPNLEHLALTCARYGLGELGGFGFASASAVDPFVAQELGARRAENKDDQLEYGSWQRLRVVEGSVADVYTLGLVCHVPELRLQGDVTRHMGHMLEDVLDDVRPEALSLTVVGGFMFDEDGVMSGLLAGPAAQCLRALDLEICFVPSEGNVDISCVLEHIVQALVYLPLRTLRLTLNHGLLDHPSERKECRSPLSGEGYLCPAKRSLMELDVEGYATRLKDAIAFVEDATVRLSNDPTSHEHLLLSYRDGGLSLEERSDGAPSEGEEVVQELAELGFGSALDDDDGGW